MPRMRRFLLSQSYYHIMTRGNNKNVVFKSGDDFEYYLKLILRYKLQHPFNLFHYCLMPNHTHFLIQTKKALDFSIFMKKLNLAYYHHFNREYGWAGHFWQDRYKSQAIGKDDYFIQCGKYIELNPLRAGIVDQPNDYQYSSYNYYVNGKSNQLITPDFLYKEMAKDDVKRRQRYNELIIDQIVEETYKGKIWGSDWQRYREQDKIRRKV